MTSLRRDPRGRRVGMVTFGALCWVLAGCASRVTVSGPGEPALNMGVVVLYSAAASPGTSRRTGLALVDCVTSAVAAEVPELRLVAVEDFARAAFPGIQLAEIPVSPDSVARLAGDSEFRAQAAAAGVRYLIIVEGQTTEPPPEGGAVAGGGMGGGAILGFWMWERDSMAGAVVYDLEARDSIGRIEVHVSGRPWFAILGIFPLGAPSFTESWACQKLGASVASFLRGTGRRSSALP